MKQVFLRRTPSRGRRGWRNSKLNLLLLLAFCLNLNPTPVCAQNKTTPAETRTLIAHLYNTLYTFTDEQWTETIGKLSTQMAGRGETARAKQVLELSDPEIRKIFLKQLQTQLEERSQNGIVWLVCYSIGGCNIYSRGWMITFVVFSFLSLDGETAVNF